MGRPYQAIPNGKFMYVHHIVVDDKIDLFVVDKEGSRLYTIKNTNKAREQLEKGKRKSKSGIPQEGEFKKKSNKKFLSKFKIKTHVVYKSNTCHKKNHSLKSSI